MTLRLRNVLFYAIQGFVILLVSCVGGDILEPTDPTIQAEEDSVTIVNYFADLGFEADSILDTGVFYKILDEGTGDTTILESDVVMFNYVGKLLNDTIFDTNIEEVADSIRFAVEENITEGDTTDTEFALLITFDEDRNYEPFTEVYSASGWTISGSYIDGFADGVTATFRQLRVGGSALIVLPSAEAYGTIGSGFFIDPNTVIAFELYPVAVKSQTP